MTASQFLTQDMEFSPQPLTDDARWALVTGASAGIGRVFCQQLAAQGWHLVLVARRADRLHALAADLKKRHETACLVLPADLADPGASAHIADELARRDIFVEFLVNNAGYGQPGYFQEVPWARHRDFVQVMVLAVCELTWRLLPEMQQRKRGFIINVASVAGLVSGSKAHTLYGAAKAFLINFSESLALENESRGVRVSVLCPGFTHSEFHDVSKTRDLVNRLPSFMWLDTDAVVAYGLDSVTRKRPRIVAVPGLFYRFLVWANHAVPGLGLAFSRRLSRRFRKLD